MLYFIDYFFKTAVVLGTIHLLLFDAVLTVSVGVGLQIHHDGNHLVPFDPGDILYNGSFFYLT